VQRSSEKKRTAASPTEEIPPIGLVIDLKTDLDMLLEVAKEFAL
jgi:hypothetical protein